MVFTAVFSMCLYFTEETKEMHFCLIDYVAYMANCLQSKFNYI